MELTSHEINIIIAKSLGYTEENNVWTKPKDKYGTIMRGPHSKIVPNYCRDQNAIIDLVRDLKKGERQQYVTELSKFYAGDDPSGKGWHNLNASARERALAWLKVKKLVEDGEPVVEVG